MKTKCARIVVLALVVSVSGIAMAASEVEKEITALIVQDFEYTKKNKEDRPDSYSKDGALEFWSSGGLLQELPARPPVTRYESFNLNPKHIRVLQVADDVAVAFFYSEGSFKEQGSATVPHYMTRATQVFVKEQGGWKVRAAHWSPVAAGSGTNQTAAPVD